MKELFLSASVPLAGRGRYYETADPFLIQVAVRELVAATIRDYVLVWGGHPAITPMVWAICQDLGVEYASSVVLYQSKFFEDRFPEENERFRNTIYVPEVQGDREASLRKMREAMLSRANFEAAVFIGGMDGVEEEFRIFKQFHPSATVLAVGAPGGAARLLATEINDADSRALGSVDFARLFREYFLSEG